MRNCSLFILASRCVDSSDSPQIQRNLHSATATFRKQQSRIQKTAPAMQNSVKNVLKIQFNACSGSFIKLVRLDFI